jgi:hypothetical protein
MHFVEHWGIGVQLLNIAATRLCHEYVRSTFNSGETGPFGLFTTETISVSLFASFLKYLI